MLVDESHLTLADDGAWHTSSALAAVDVPPSIAALLAARLDQLPPGERSLAERASVMGKSFEQAALAELVPAGQRDAPGARPACAGAQGPDPPRSVAVVRRRCVPLPAPAHPRCRL